MKLSTRQQGQKAELKARMVLEQAGLIHQKSNYTCRLGEIDLIMKAPSGLLIFVEVRQRTNRYYATALESITRQKQIKIIKASQFYLLAHPNEGHCGIRFDVVTFDGPTSKFSWIKGAFEDVS